MARITGTAALAAIMLSACASTADVTIRKKEKLSFSQAGFIPGRLQPPQERNGVSIHDTGAILFVCANSEKHDDREVLISNCSKCSEKNYFYFDPVKEEFVCYACEAAVPSEMIKCDECGKAPRRVRTKNTGHGG